MDVTGPFKLSIGSNWRELEYLRKSGGLPMEMAV